MRKRLFGTGVAAVAVALAFTACGSSSSGGSGGSGSSGKVTLKLVAADYGTGPRDHAAPAVGVAARAGSGGRPRSPTRTLQDHADALTGPPGVRVARAAGQVGAVGRLSHA